MSNTDQPKRDAKASLPLIKAVELLLNECRRVLPGIQAMFGFQLIAVFNAGFHDRLSHGQQVLHIVALGMTAIAVAMIMTPAAFHRQNDPHQVTEAFIRLCTTMMLASMVPLALGICTDFFIVASIVIDESTAGAIAGLLLAIFLTLWFVVPRLSRTIEP